MEKIKVGLIGAGYIGLVHLEMLRRLAAVDIVAVADSDPGRAGAAAEKFGIPKIHPRAEDLVRDPGVEVVHNCTPNVLHFGLNRDAIEAGKDVLSEKPLALDARESGELVRLAAARGAATGVNFCYRYYPVVQEAAARVRRGDLGEVRALVGHFLQDWLFYDTDYSWRLDPSVAGGVNVLADLGSHWADLVQFVTGRKIVEVLAELHTCIPKRKKPVGGALSFGAGQAAETVDVDVKLDDYAATFLRLDNGARGNFTTCQVAAGRKVDIELQVFGSKESYAWSHVRPNELWIGRRDRGNETFYESAALQTGGTGKYATLPTGHPMGYHDAVFNLFRDYYEAVAAKRRGGSPIGNAPDFRTGHDMMLILDAARASAKSGTWAKVQR